ncbi:MAG: tetraacyldisaccharide 4'-kinase, partial [Candidatus Omnitrophica bacterium]|nr:tetraacyldisaccharide 4'-kinase [Candidatus Omnitrophota bacterium]
REGLVALLIKGLLRILSWGYAVGIGIVGWMYHSRIRKEHRAPVPVISVGNITLGGTGKTPFTMFLAEYLLQSGRSPAILIRGYGEDENRMIKDTLADVPVFVGQNRLASARSAAGNGCDVLVLDDGFQHRKLARDLNIVLVDSVRFFGNESLFPRGTLREPVSSLERADILVLTKVDQLDELERERASEKLKGLSKGKSVVQMRHKPFFLNDVTGGAYQVDSIKNEKVCLVSGIVDPDYFAFLIKGLGAEIVSRFDFDDHHQFTRVDMMKVYKRALETKADKIIITKKDHVKIKDLDVPEIEEKLFVLDIVLDIVKGRERLIAGLNSIMAGNRA